MIDTPTEISRRADRGQKIVSIKDLLEYALEIVRLKAMLGQFTPKPWWSEESSTLVNRLRGNYPVGPITDGVPEFGFRSFPDRPPIQIEAAARIEQLEHLLHERNESDERSVGLPIFWNIPVVVNESMPVDTIAIVTPTTTGQSAKVDVIFNIGGIDELDQTIKAVADSRKKESEK